MHPDTPSDPPRQHITLGGGPAAFTDSGTGPVVVLVHGLPGSARDYRWLGAALESRMRVIRVDMPGFGETPLSTQPSPTVVGRGQFVVDLVRALDLDRPVLIGHSMGGAVVAAAAVAAPDLFRGVGLLASVGGRAHRSLRKMWPKPRWISKVLSLPGIPWLISGRLQREYARHGFKGWTTEQLVHSMHCVAALEFEAHAVNLSALKVPTLVAWCRDDPFVEASICEETAHQVPSGPRLIFDDGGHNLQKTHAISLADTITSWSVALPFDS